FCADATDAAAKLARPIRIVINAVRMFSPPLPPGRQRYSDDHTIRFGEALVEILRDVWRHPAERRRARRSAYLANLLLIPLEEFPKQTLPRTGTIKQTRTGGLPTGHELVELLALYNDRRAGTAIEPLLSRTEAGPSGHRGIQGNLPPFLVERRTLEILDF